VECLPTDIPSKIVVDISALELGKLVRVSEIQVPPRVKIVTDPELVIAHVVAPRAEEVAAAPEAVAAEEAGAAEPELIKKGKTVAEGEAAAEPKAEKAEKKEKK